MSKQYAKRLEFWAFPQNTGRISMKAKTVANSLKNAVSTVFLLAGAFFVCSTFLSMRAVFADPIAPVIDPTLVGPQAQRAGNNARTSGRASPRDRQATSRKTVARTAVTNAARNQATQSRGVATRSAAQNPRANAVTSRNTAQTTQSRNVVSRQNTTVNRTGANVARTVRARTATTRNASDNARISLQGSAIHGSKSFSTSSPSYSYLSSKLYTGNYSNIIDSTTGLISAEAFDNCMTSYYTCMDEICTARNQAQRRCGCAGRVTAFAEAETALERANEELIQASGELALLIANKGKDVSDAFQLTEAEQVMNCVSWKEMSEKVLNGITDENDNEINDDTDWCHAHGIYDPSKCSKDKKPSYCESNDFGFNVNDLNGSGSDILANLQAWAKAKESTNTFLKDDEDNLFNAIEGVSGITSGMYGFNVNTTETTDRLSQKWGYELFKHAHNEVCSRVLDSCFNGIYEACGTPTGTRCANGQTSDCPFNYNSKISLTDGNEIKLQERGSGSYNTNSTAVCFGYTSTSVNNTSTDPYANLRGPVADARRSIMNKYLLDANADCDLYGEQLRATAQNISLQKAAAQQALQQKRLEFAVEERDSVLTAANEAITNFNECISEIYDCYESTADSEPNWPDARIKTYCAQISNVPHCYEEMICNPSTAQFRAVIDASDSSQCLNSQDYTKNTCRNVVTLNEILKGTGATPSDIPHEATGASAAMRELCLQDIGVQDIRDWRSDIEYNDRCKTSELPSNASAGYKNSSGTCIATSCNSGYLLQDGVCELANETDCKSEIPHATKAVRRLNGTTWGACELVSCEKNYTPSANKCVADTTDCSPEALEALNADYGTRTWNGTEWGNCVPTDCATGYDWNTDKTSCVPIECETGKHLEGDSCVSNTQKCSAKDLEAEYATAGTQTWNPTNEEWGQCVIETCKPGYELKLRKCIKITCTEDTHLDLIENKCVANTKPCEKNDLPDGATKGQHEWMSDLGRWGLCKATECEENMTLNDTTGECMLPLNPGHGSLGGL